MTGGDTAALADNDQCPGGCPGASVCSNGQCVCPPGTEGEPSSGCTPVDHCRSQPCSNGGVCSNNATTFSCSCAPGWRGVTCQEDIPECDTRPCLNGATCLETRGSFTCQCRDGFTGERCEQDIDECLQNPCVRGNCVNLVSRYLLSSILSKFLSWPSHDLCCCITLSRHHHQSLRCCLSASGNLTQTFSNLRDSP